MKINTLIKLWYDSKYDYIYITNLPVVRSDNDVVCPTATFKKNSKIVFGGEIDVIDYLKEIYNYCIFLFTSITDDSLCFTVIENLKYFY